jgi:hypothetical protein
MPGSAPYPAAWVRIQAIAARASVVRAHADETAPAGQVPDQWPCFAGLVAGVEAAAMEVQQDRHARWPIVPVVYVQRTVWPVAVGESAHPDHIAPSREERGAQDAAPRPSRPAGVVQRRVGTQRTANHDPQAGQREQRDGGTSSAARRVEVAVGEREHSRRDQQVCHDERQLTDEQRGDLGERTGPAPPVQRARDPQDRTATVHQYPTGIRNCPPGRRARVPCP